MKTSEVLWKAANLLKTKGHCKRLLARDAGGMPVPFSSPDAASYCARGAVMAADSAWSEIEACDAVLDTVIDAPGLWDDSAGRIINWNNADERTADEVIIAFDAAYVLALQEEGIDPAEVLE